MGSNERTFVGYATLPGSPSPDVEGSDQTVVDRLDAALESGERFLFEDSRQHALLTRDMVEELRAKLRAAEEAERSVESGVFLRTPANGLGPVDAELEDDVALALDVEVQAPVEAPSEAAAEPAPEAPATLPELPEAIVPEGLTEAAALASSLDDVISAVPELEASLAPNSESNFYAGFDEEHPDGVFVATYQHLAVGTPVYVEVHLPAGYRFRTPAVVEWMRDDDAGDPELPCGLGLRMCGLDRASRRLIRTYAKHRKPIFWIG